MEPTLVWPTRNAVYEAASFAGWGDTNRSYGFVTVRTVKFTCKTAAGVLYNRMPILRHAPVQEHSVSCGWKPLRIRGSFGRFDSATGGVYVILEGAFVKTVSR